jgi:isoamylase
MVRGLHAAGLEVILEVVFNHTAEGDEQGPTLCFRGFDNGAYYRLGDDRSRYVDLTKTGKTFGTHRPQVLRLIMGSLRYWVLEMHVARMAVLLDTSDGSCAGMRLGETSRSPGGR